MNSLSSADVRVLFTSVKHVLLEMTRLGGRDPEKDLFGNPGGYPVVMCARSRGNPCPRCGTAIVKQTYLGGSVYYCPECQQA